MKISSNSCAISMASTWIWAPALFVSSSIAYNYGILGLLLFLVPNVLTLFIFGYIAQEAVKRNKISQGISGFNCSKRIKKLQQFVAIFLQLCSFLVQLMGINLLLNIFELSPLFHIYILGIYTLIAILISYRGFQIVVNTDILKYLITLGIGIILLYLSYTTNTIESINLDGFRDKGYLVSFGIVTSIGLLTAPYIDETFWQRALSVEPEKVFSTFIKAGLYFILVPTVFGCIGLLYSSLPFIEEWNISDTFKVDKFTAILLIIAISSTLLSTMDSSVSALSNLLKIKNKDLVTKVLFLSLFPLLVMLSYSLTKITTITTVFLFYGTVRTCMFIPIILYIFTDKTDWNKLNLYSQIAIIFSLTVYPLLATFFPDYSFIGVLLAFTLPLLAYRRR